MPSQPVSRSREGRSACKLLILEDSATDAELEQHALRKAGLNFIAKVVATEPAFVDALHRFDPDIVLVDFQVPGFNGVEAAREVKQWRADVPVILATGVLSDEAAGDFIKAGISDYVLKDRFARLPAAVRNALSEADDVRARLRAEAQRDALARILECAEDGVIGKNLAGTVIAWNASAARIFGRAAGEAVGCAINEALGRFYTTSIDDAVRKVEQDGSVTDLKVQYCDDGDDGRVLALSLSPIRDAAANITGSSIIIRDITDEKRVQLKLSQTTAQLTLSLQQISETNIALQREIEVRRAAEVAAAGARQDAERANEAKSSYLSHVSHEIRTPMTSIIGFADLLLDSRLSQDQAKKVRHLREAACSLLAIVNDILDISAIESGRLRLATAPTNLRAVLEAVLATVRPGAGAKALELHCNIAADVPCWVEADPERLRQVLLNLMGNAVKFTDHGIVAVSVGCDPASRGSLIRFEVSDTGIGIPLDRQGQLFREFYRVGQPHAREAEGSGLGLAISRRLVEAMGGSIGVTSSAGSGSTFWFLAPLPGMAQAPASAPRAQSVEHGNKGRILVAEDLPMNQMIITEMLETAGHTVMVVADGVSAITALQTGTFDVVLMDMEMPVMGGLEATRKVRSLRQTLRTPIVALTANAMPQQIADCRAAGMDDYLSKPIDRTLLLHTVDRWIGQEAPTHAIIEQNAFDELAARFGREQAHRFLAVAREHLERVIGCLPDCGDRAATRHALHDLVSVAGNVGLRDISEQSRRLMTAIQSNAGDVPVLTADLLSAARTAAALVDEMAPCQ